METQKNYENKNFSQNKTETLQENKEEKSLDEKFNELNDYLKKFRELYPLMKNFENFLKTIDKISKENNILDKDLKSIFKIIEIYLQKNLESKTNQNFNLNLEFLKQDIENFYSEYLKKWWKNIKEIEDILDNSEKNSNKILEIYFLLNFSSLEDKLISPLSEEQKLEVLEKKKNKDLNLAKYFNENSWLYITNYFQIYKLDKNFETKDINIIDYLPKNEFIERIISEKISKENLKNLNLKAFFLEPNNNSFTWKVSTNNIIIFPQNIMNFEKLSKEEIEKFINWTIRNEAMHILWNNIWWHDNINYDFSEILWDIFANIPEENKKWNINEFLSDYSSIISWSKYEIKRIIWNSFICFFREINWDEFEFNWYVYTARFHTELIHKILWKNFSDYFENFSELQVDSKKLDNKQLEQKYNIEKNLEKIYQDLENKIIIYNGKKINWIEYLIIKNQEKWDEIMEKIYQNLK